MGLLSRLIVSLGLDASDYSKGLDKADSATGSKLSSMGSKLQSVGKTMTGWGAGLTAGVTTPIVGLGLASINAASDMEESLSKVGVVFGESAGSVISFSETAATSLGQSQQEALEAAGTFGNLFVAMGMSEDVSADMSKGLVTLGSDLASFNNAMPIEALEALRAGLTGETEPLKRFGINMTAAAVAQKALDMGIVETTVDQLKAEDARWKFIEAQKAATAAEQEFGASSIEAQKAQLAVAQAQAAYDKILEGTTQELTSAQKAQAVYALIMEQTTTAQGDFARTSEGLANKTRIVKAQLADAAATMGQQLLPIGLKIVNFVSGLIQKFTDLSPSTQKIILIVAGLAAALGPVLAILGPIVAGIGAIAGILSGPVVLAIGAVVGAVALLVAAWKNNWGGIRDTLTAIWNDTIKPALEKLWEWLKVNIPKAIEVLKGFWENTLLPAIKKVWEFIQDNVFPLLETLWEWLKETIPKALETLRGFWEDTLLPAIKAVWEFIQDSVIPILEALWELLSVTLAKALEALQGLWENVLLPAIKAVWEFIQDKVIPIFQTIIRVIEEELAPVFEWLKNNVIDPVAAAFAAVGEAIDGILGFIKDLIEKIKNIQLPSWLTPGSPTPFELGLWGINRALKAVARAGMPELEMSIAGVSRGGAPMGSYGGVPLAAGGDQIVINNYDATSAALTMARIEERRRMRLNLSMG